MHIRGTDVGFARDYEILGFLRVLKGFLRV